MSTDVNYASLEKKGSEGILGTLSGEGSHFFF